MTDDQLHHLYTFLTRRFDAIDARFDGIDIRLDGMDARFDENEIVQNEILNALGVDLAEHHTLLKQHDAHITTLERRTAS